MILEGDGGDQAARQLEDEADRFAADALIPPRAYKAFTEERRFSEEDVQRFAEQTGISAGIVVGRLQNDDHLDRSRHNNLRIRFDWK